MDFSVSVTETKEVKTGKIIFKPVRLGYGVIPMIEFKVIQRPLKYTKPDGRKAHNSEEPWTVIHSYFREMKSTDLDGTEIIHSKFST